VSTAQTRPQNSKASFAHQHPCGLKSALRRSRGATLNTYDADETTALPIFNRIVPAQREGTAGD